MDLNTSPLTVSDSASISLCGNLVTNDSTIGHISRGTVTFQDTSEIRIDNNTAFNKSRVLSVAGNINSDNSNVNVRVVNNSAAEDSIIIALDQSIGSIRVPYYDHLLEEYNREKEIFFNDLLGSIYNFCYFRTSPFIRFETLVIIPGNPHTVERPRPLPQSTITLSGSLSFRGNSVKYKSIALSNINSTVVTTGLFSENLAQNSSFLNNATTTLRERSYVSFTRNEILRDSSLFLSVGGFWGMEIDSELLVTENIAKNGFSLLFFSANASLNGLVRLTNNNLSDFGVLNIFKSTVWFEGSLEVIGNRAESGAITADNSDLYLTNTATFSDNWASNGGAVTLTSSVMYISPTATVEFIRNQAIMTLATSLMVQLSFSGLPPSGLGYRVTLILPSSSTLTSEDINITAETSNTQCQYQRSGVLCGSCREGLSMVLGSSECRSCSNGIHWHLYPDGCGFSYIADFSRHDSVSRDSEWTHSLYQHLAKQQNHISTTNYLQV